MVVHSKNRIMVIFLLDNVYIACQSWLKRLQSIVVLSPLRESYQKAEFVNLLREYGNSTRRQKEGKKPTDTVGFFLPFFFLKGR